MRNLVIFLLSFFTLFSFEIAKSKETYFNCKFINGEETEKEFHSKKKYKEIKKDKDIPLIIDTDKKKIIELDRWKDPFTQKWSENEIVAYFKLVDIPSPLNANVISEYIISRINGSMSYNHEVKTNSKATIPYFYSLKKNYNCKKTVKKF